MRNECVRLAVLGAWLLLARAEARDYEAGFAKFFGLGLPDVTAATYVTLEAHGGPGFVDMDSEIPREAGLAGNAWLVKEDKQGLSTFVVEQRCVVRLYDEAFQEKQYREARRQGRRERIRRAERWAENEPAGTWRPADLDTDIAALTAFLSKTAESDKRRRLDSDSYAEIFFFAANIHRRGRSAEAGQLVDTLFGIAGDPREVVLAGMNALAESQYTQLYRTFRDAKDWDALGRGIEELLERFPLGWRTAPAAKRLLGLIANRVAQPDPPAVEGEGLTDAHRTLATALATATDWSWEQRYPARNHLWVLGAASRRGKGPVQAGEPDMAERITGMRMQAVPLLLALVKDDYLTGIDMADVRGYRHVRHHYSSRNEELTEERIAQLFDEMQRPARRGDIARALLRPLLIAGDRRSYELDRLPAGPFRKACAAWYAANRDKTPSELAALYLKKEDHQQSESALWWLLVSTNASDNALAEQHLLEAADPDRHQYVVREYVAAKGAAAEEFALKYIALLEQKLAAEPADAEPRDARFRRYRDESRKAAVKYLRDAVAGKSLAELLAELAGGRATWEDVDDLLTQRLVREEESAAVSAVLEAARKAEAAPLRVRLIALVPHIGVYRRYGRYMDAGMADEEPADAPPLKLNVADHAEMWKKLIADERPCQSDEWPDWTGETMAVADTARWAIEALYSAEDDEERSSGALLYLWGERGRALLRARADARLAGKAENELPPYPAPDRVSAERRREIQTALAAAEPAAVAGLAAGLSLDELAAVAEACACDQELNRRLLPAANTIRAVHAPPGDPALGERTAALKGKVFDRAMAESLKQICEDLLKDGQPAACSVVRPACLEGITVRIRPMPDSRADGAGARHREGGADHPVVAGVVSSVPGLYAHALWAAAMPGAGDKTPAGRDAGGAATRERVPVADAEPGDAHEPESPQAQEQFWNTLADLCSGNSSVCEYATVSFAGLMPGATHEEQ
ncbi:MAG: hypothetical protein JXR37_06020 [Kiritimatiellae bacterium]|nr:hypothetical protein [Kiritimatiellia bacterium]